MAGTKITNAEYNSSTNWQDETISKDYIKVGYYNMEFSNMDTTSESIIQAGSVIDIEGTLYIFEGVETPTGSIVSGTNYIRTYDSAATALLEYSQVAPTYDYDKKGWYSSSKRYIFQFEDYLSSYSDKYIMTDNIETDYGIIAPINELRQDVEDFLAAL